MSLLKISPGVMTKDGPLAVLPGFDWIGQSYAGIIDLLGKRDDTPVFVTHAYGAIVTALMHRMRGGKGQYIDI